MSSAARVPPAVAAEALAGFVTPDDLALTLGISQRTLARWHARRIGPARCVVGRLVLYRVDAVRDWLSGLERAPPGRHRPRR